MDEKQDRVESPAHYCFGNGMQAIDVIELALSREQFAGYLRGNVLKYVLRYPRKEGVVDLKKAAKYLEWLIRVEGK